VAWRIDYTCKLTNDNVYKSYSSPIIPLVLYKMINKKQIAVTISEVYGYITAVLKVNESR